MRSRRRRLRPLIDALEPRQYLSAWTGSFQLAHGLSVAPPTAQITLQVAKPSKNSKVTPAASSSPPLGFSPQQIAHAYGLDQVTFGTIAGDGSGQTIALIDAYDDPNALSDLQTFDQQFRLPDPPSFQRVNEFGQTSNYPNTFDAANNPTYGWQLEESLDIEYAHAMAPAANIILVEANSNSLNDLISNGVNWARSQPGVSVISMSFGSDELSGETVYDQYFTTPGTHNGVTFVASTGDSAEPGSYPAYSPNVVAVGGTSLTLNSDGSYAGESGWNKGGGGPGVYEAKPSYQANVETGDTHRSTPDIALDANPNTGVAVYDSFNNSGWEQVGGTSLSAPLFAGMVAVADQGRVLAGMGTLDGRNDTLPKLYADTTDFHDITSGNNGFQAGVGYDLVTGLGSPMANLLIPDLVGVAGSISGHVYADNNGDGTFDAGDTPLAGVTVYLDLNGNGQLDTGGGTQTQSIAPEVAIPDQGSVSSTIAISNLGSFITSMSLTLTITHPRDFQLSASLIGPDGTTIELFPAGMGGTAAQFSSPDFTNTIFSDSASTPIASGSAPYTGTFQPAQPLSTFNGKSADGTWTLVVNDTIRRQTGSLNSWSLSITTANDPSTLTGTDGSYTFGSLAVGKYVVREVVPSGYTSGTPSATPDVTGAISGVDFANTPALPYSFTATASGETFYLWLNGANLDISTNGTPTNPAYQLPLSTIASLAFHLTTDSSKLIVNYTTGDPIPGQLLLDGSGLATSELDIIGSATPITMTDTTVGNTGGGVIDYSNLGGIAFNAATVHFTGTLDNLQTLNLLNNTTFYWDG